MDDPSHEPALEAERARTLLEINNAIIGSLTRDALFGAVARALHRAVPFERSAIFLHDPVRDVLRLFVLESTLPTSHYVVGGLEVSPGDSHVGWVFSHQRPLLRRDLAEEREYPLEEVLVAEGVRAFVVVPLVARGRSIGTLGVASATPGRYTEADALFLQQVANQVSLAVENMKAYEEIRSLTVEATRAADRYRTLLDINNAIMSNLTQEALFQAITKALHRVVSFDRSAIFLHDPAWEVLRLLASEATPPSTYFTAGREVDPDQSDIGWVFRHQQPLLRRDLPAERAFPSEDVLVVEGIRSSVIVPLVAHGRCIGTLGVASGQPERYAEADAQILQQVAYQVALAVENMRAFEEIAALHARVAAAAERAREAEALLRSITEGTASATGSDFFPSLVRHLAAAFGARFAFVTECRPDARARYLAFWKGDHLAARTEYDTAATPCQKVLAGEICYYPRDVRALFPRDQDLVDLAAESYLGMPMEDVSGRIVGHIAIIDDRPWGDQPPGVPVLRVFAARAAAELRRQEAEEQLRSALEEVRALKQRLEAENVYLQEEISRAHNFEEMVGTSPALVGLLRQVEQVAPTDATVLVLGETGAGKELIARAIHDRSARRDRPLVKVNCAAISAGLVESELFGHVKGAFTGAIESRVGRFQLADGGTIFLDEVGELPLETQVKLLRVLQDQEFEPVGSSRSVRVDVRVIAATNRDLDEAVRSGRFRPDLFYRLNVFPLTVPSLRERRTDIPQLVMFFVTRFAKRFGKKIDSVSPETMGRLVAYGWPGNIRELQNVIERATVLCPGPMLELDEALLPMATPGRGRDAPGPAAPRDAAPPTAAGPAVTSPTLEEMERRHIEAVLRETGGQIEGPEGAAKILGLHPNTLRSRMQKLGIKRRGHDIS